MTRFRSPLRASHLRDVLTQGEGITVRDIKPPQVQEPPKAVPQLIGPENIRSESLSKYQLMDRTRYAWLELGGATVRTGTGTLAMRGANTKYRAWNFRDAQSDEIALTWGFPADMVQVTGSPLTLGMRLLWENLGAAAGAVVWKITINEVNNAPTALNTVADSIVSVTESAGTQDQSVFSAAVASPFAFTITPDANLDAAVNIRIMRDGTAVPDTLTNDAGLLGVRIEYTADM